MGYQVGARFAEFVHLCPILAGVLILYAPQENAMVCISLLPVCSSPCDEDCTPNIGRGAVESRLRSRTFAVGI